MDVRIESVESRAYRVPTDGPEADGTFAWDSTTLVTVHVRGGGREGFGYSYGSAAIVRVVADLRERLVGGDALAPNAALAALRREVRNIGEPGIAAMALSAIDVAIWDLEAKLLELPLHRLLGPVRDRVPVYGSGGFTTYTIDRLHSQLRGWVDEGIRRVKMKVGTHPEDDDDRVRAAREAIGDAGLMVDANGAYSRKEALQKAVSFADQGVEWFEEPVPSDDLEGLRLLRDEASVPIAAGEYGSSPLYFRRMLEAGAVDVLQADATRCLGITGFLAAATLADAFGVPLSAHCAPSIHRAVGCAARPLVHVEHFYDHARLEAMLFDGFAPPEDGDLVPDPARPGLGVELRSADAERFRVA